MNFIENLERKVAFKNYLMLVNGIEQSIIKLLEIFQDKIKCKIHCSYCCDKNLYLNSIEIFNLIRGINESSDEKRDLILKSLKNFKNDNKKSTLKCPLLYKDICLLYEFRPIICRTHGFPIIELIDNKPYKLSTCELNFSEKEIKELQDNLFFNMVPIHKILFILNNNFLTNNLIFSKSRYYITEIIDLLKL